MKEILLKPIYNTGMYDISETEDNKQIQVALKVGEYLLWKDVELSLLALDLLHYLDESKWTLPKPLREEV